MKLPGGSCVDRLPERSDEPDHLACSFRIGSHIYQHDIGPHLAEPDFQRLLRWIGLQLRDNLESARLDQAVREFLSQVTVGRNEKRRQLGLVDVSAHFHSRLSVGR